MVDSDVMLYYPKFDNIIIFFYSLKEEIVARMAAERRLKHAESSLKRLERNVERPAVQEEKPAEEVRQEMIGDVKTLKSK